MSFIKLRNALENSRRCKTTASSYHLHHLQVITHLGNVRQLPLPPLVSCLVLLTQGM